jgi:hypothetical protein
MALLQKAHKYMSPIVTNSYAFKHNPFVINRAFMQHVYD